MCRDAIELEGREFDWFAVDYAGNVALFATAGTGPVPESVIPFANQHDEISESIDTPRWGSLEIWYDFAAVGLFVFDWSLPSGPYVKVAEPTAAVSSELRSKLSQLPGLSVFPFEFDTVSVLTLEQLS